MTFSRARLVTLLAVFFPAAWFACGNGDNGGDAGLDATADASIDAAKDVVTDQASDAAPDAPPPCLVDASSPWLVDAIDVSLGADFGCALRQDHTVACWGSNQYGEVSQGGGSSMNAPLSIVFPSDAGAVHITRIAAGAYAVCGVDDQTRVWCWGGNYFGQLGQNLPSDSLKHAPGLVIDANAQTLSGVTDLAAGYDSFCAATKSGPVYCWGHNEAGELGSDASSPDDGGPPSIHSLVAVPATNVNFPSGTIAKGAGGYTHCVTDGTHVTCFGNNNQYECATTSPVLGAFNANVATELAQAGATLPITDITEGLLHACAVDSAHRLYCWGDNASQQGTSGGAVPTVHPAFADGGAERASGGYKHTCVLDTNEHAVCFGNNGGYGYLGAGDAGNFMTSTPLTVVDVDGGPALFPVARVIAGGDQSCAILAGSCGASGPGSVVCWGYGLTGNLGNDAGTTSAIPVHVTAP